MLKIQFLNGGLATQAFQYIFAKHYEISHPGEIMYLDDTLMALAPDQNRYDLGRVFGIRPHMLSEAFDVDVWEYIIELRRQGKSTPQILKDNGTDLDLLTEFDGFGPYVPFDGPAFLGKTNAYDPDVQNVERNTYFYGFWMNRGWFDKYQLQFRMEFSFPSITDNYNAELMRRICNERSVGLHVYRGDYVKSNIAYGAAEYASMTEACMAVWGGDAVVYVFSDDIPWCKENSSAMGLDQFREVVYVEGNTGTKSYIDLQLMSNCDVMMVGNSPMAFLAAILNTRYKFVVNKSGRNI